MAETMDNMELLALIAAVDRGESSYAWGPDRRGTIVTPRLIETLHARIVATRKFGFWEHVRLINRPSWLGRIVGFYRTPAIQYGYCVQGDRGHGEVRTYPESRLEAVDQ